MPIINGAQTQKKTKIRAEINEEIFQKIVKYCEWAGISDVSFFIEEAASFVFSKDRDWKQRQKTAEKQA